MNYVCARTQNYMTFMASRNWLFHFMFVVIVWWQEAMDGDIDTIFTAATDRLTSLMAQNMAATDDGHDACAGMAFGASLL
jgi:hypothetical protein